ncbi:MAG: LapA family protein [Sphingomicrobium sp.]
MTTFTLDHWMIVALVFVLGLLIGMFLTAGGRRKWKTRYRDESTRREALEKEHREHAKRYEERDKEYRELEARHDKLVNARPAPVEERPVVVEDRPVTRGRTVREERIVDERPIRDDDINRR